MAHTVNHEASPYWLDRAETVAIAVSALELLAALITVVILGVLYLRHTVSSPHHFGRAVCALGAGGLLIAAFYLDNVQRSPAETRALREELKASQHFATAMIIVALACIVIGILQLYGILNPAIVVRTFVLLIGFIGLISVSLSCATDR